MDNDNERYFPNHQLEKEIGLAEYNLAAHRLANDDQALTWSTNATIVLSTAVGFVSFKANEYKDGLDSSGISAASFKAAFLIAICLLSVTAIAHIANLIKSRVFAERKIIVLRRMLGVRYGESTLVLPNWRLEGADNPFAIPMFSGYFSYKSFPVHVLLIMTSLSLLLLLPTALSAVPKPALFGGDGPHIALFIAPWYASGLLIFRYHLRETNENTWLSTAKILAKLLRIELAANFENSIYRIRLEIAEVVRLKSDLASAKKFAIHIEDREFSIHGGVNWRGIFRALKGYVRGKNSGGGSSITQQLVRSHFIIRPQPTLRRKLVEMILARWIECFFTKQEIIFAYLATARFDNRIYGFHRAFRHFYNAEATYVEPWEAFILIERLGNIRGKFLGRRILSLLQSCIKYDMLDRAGAQQALHYYKAMVGTHFELGPNDLSPSEVLERLKAA